ncbi:unnamed protein product [Closterium sp. NIES-65]|nr:unnamed protein product [Closterium sp. NIES-65]
MAGAEYSTSSYIAHDLKGLPRSYNLMKRFTMVPGTRGRAAHRVPPQASYAAPTKSNRQQEQRGSPGGGGSGGGQSTKDVEEKRSTQDKCRRGGGRRRECWICGDPDHLSFECPDRDDNDEDNNKGGRGRSASRRPRRDEKPRKEKQASKKTSSTKDVDTSSGKSRDNGEASCSMVGVVEPMVLLAPEAGEDFQAVAAAVQANPMVVLLDSGCFHDLMGTKAVFADMAPSDRVKHIRGFNGALQLVKGRGTVALQGEEGKQVLIPDALYVPGVQGNLLSAGQLKESRVQLQGDGDGMLLVTVTGEVVALRTIVSATASTPDWLHARLAHVGVDTIKSSAKHEVAVGLDIMPSTGADPPRVSCVRGKLARHTFPNKGSDAKEVLAVMHIDLCGPFRVAAKDGSLYFLLLKDCHTWFVWTMPVAKKSNVLREFQKWLGWEVLDLTDNKVVTSVEVIFYETLSLEVWKATYGPASGRTQAHSPTDTSTSTIPLLTEVNEPVDDDVVEVLPPTPVLAPPSLVADRPASTPVSATGDEGSREASPVVPASGNAGGRQGAKLVDQDGKVSTTGEHQIGEPVEQEATEGVQSTGEQQPGQSIGELSKSAVGEQLVEGSKQLVDDEDVDEEGEQSAGEESTDSDVVEVQITKPELRRTGRARRPPERLSFHACLPPDAFTTVYNKVDDDLLYDDTDEDEDPPKLELDVHTDPKHHWDIATMTVKEALSSSKGEAVKAAMKEEIPSLIGMGTRELVERPRGVNIMKNRWVLTTKYRIDNTVEREKARLVVKGFTQVYGADYDETYSPVSSYVTLRIFLSIPDYFNDGTGRVCKLLKSLYGLKQSPLLWFRALDSVLLGAGWKKSQVDEALYFKDGNDRMTCWVLVYVDDLLTASSSTAMLKELKELLVAAFELREILTVVNYLGLEIVRDRPARKLWLHQQGYANKLRRRFIDKEQGDRVPKTSVLVDTYAELTFDDEEA